tara:strand:- start:3660 stop:4133 length:474 start_codon:yes stop_codon:yes gene_type:complete
MATLTVTHTESLTLNGSQQGSTNTLTIASVNEVYKRIVTCPANSETTLINFHSSVADGTLSPVDMQSVRYIRLTNLDGSNDLKMSLQIDVGEDDSSADTSATILVKAGSTFVMGYPEDAVGVSDANANLVTDLVDLESIVIQPGGNAIKVELFVVSA